MQMDRYTQVIGKIIRKKDLAKWSKVMARLYTMESGKMTKNMEKVALYRKAPAWLRVFGVVENWPKWFSFRILFEKYRDIRVDQLITTNYSRE